MEIKVLLCVLSFAVCAVAKLHPCYDEDDLESAARHKLHHQQNIFPTQASTVPQGCPVALYEKAQSKQERSLSPWTYVERKLPEHFPSTYYEAKCLCEGCIIVNGTGEPEENFNYGSVPVTQSRVFLKRELCEETGQKRRYSLTRVNVNVTVACTCVRPLYEYETYD